MGLFSDLKKVLFGAKAITKSAADKTVDFSKEKGKDLAESGGKVFDKTKDIAEDLGKKVLDKTEYVFDKTKDIAEDLGEKIMGKKKKESVEDITSDIFEEETPTVKTEVEKAEDLLKEHKNELGDTNLAENKTGISEESENFFDNAKDQLEKTAEKAKEKAIDFKEKLDAKVDEKINHFKEKEAEIEANKKYIDPEKSTLEGTDDFFSKASKFADGDYHGTGDTPKKEGWQMVDDAKDKIADTGKLAGFEDLDGDGDELVDDAIIDEENKDDDA